MNTESPERVERLVMEIAGQISSILPETPAYARRALAIAGKSVIWPRSAPRLWMGRVAAAAVATAASLTLGWVVANGGIIRIKAAHADAPGSSISSHVLLMPDGGYQLFVIEDRHADPVELWRVITVQSLSASDLPARLRTKTATVTAPAT